MRIPTHLSLILFFVVVGLVNYAHALPTPDSHTFSSSIVRRQTDNAPFNGPETVQTVQTIETGSGPATETCIITLTPIVVNGENLVLEDQECTTVVDAPGNSAGSQASDGSSPESIPIIATLTLPGETALSTSTIALVTPVFPGTTASPFVASPGATAATIFTPIFATGTDEADNAPTATADAANSAQSTSFTLPGQKLQVLPIGLGVFAGISVIALIVVGLVTYERTKYRKAFRARKLAEQAATMGYGGTGR